MLRYCGNGYFDVLDVVGEGKARVERVLFIHRDRLTFLPPEKKP